MRILVVDDEPQLRRALQRALKLEGYEVALDEKGLPDSGSPFSCHPVGSWRR